MAFFVELADLLAENLRAQESEPHTYLDGKLVVSPARKRVVEITDILIWVQAFTIYAWVFCNAHLNRWQDLTQCKLLIMQTARQFPGPAWQTYDVAFRKDAAASGLADWSKMNLDLYNFHTRTSGVPQSSPSLLGTQSVISSCSAFFNFSVLLPLMEQRGLLLDSRSMPFSSCLRAL